MSSGMGLGGTRKGETMQSIKTNQGEIHTGSYVYYTGDCANHSGMFRVSRVNGPSRFEQGGSVDLVAVDPDDGRAWRALSPSSFSNGPGCRFLELGAYRADRRRKLAAMLREYGKTVAEHVAARRAALAH